MGKSDHRQQYIHASDVANYVVCPEAWRLKHKINNESTEISLPTKGSNEGSELRANWLEKQDLLAQLTEYAKVVYLLIVLLVVVVFLWEHQRMRLEKETGKVMFEPPQASIESGENR
jgi:hypothetical protein